MSFLENISFLSKGWFFVIKSAFKQVPSYYIYILNIHVYKVLLYFEKVDSCRK